MSYATIYNAVYGSFHEYAIDQPTERIRELIGHEPKYLADFIEAWLLNGGGMDVCHGDYTTFLTATIVIVNIWLGDPGVTDYVKHPEDDGQTLDEDDDTFEIIERRVQRVQRSDELSGPFLFDQYYFECLRRRAEQMKKS
ncbi:hypothetical protein ACWEF6_10570 [Amycolatopsis sp. NPDC004772]